MAAKVKKVPRISYQQAWKDNNRYSTADLRKLRSLRGVGPVRRIVKQKKSLGSSIVKNVIEFVRKK